MNFTHWQNNPRLVAKHRRITLVNDVRELLVNGDTRTSRQIAESMKVPYCFFREVMREYKIKVSSGRAAEDQSVIRLMKRIDKSAGGIVRQYALLPRCVLKAAGLLGFEYLKCSIGDGKIVVSGFNPTPQEKL